MAGTISAQQGALKAGQVAVNDAKAGIDAQTKKVRGEIAQLSGMWTGSAAGAFNRLMEEWDTQARKINDVLIQLEGALKSTEQDQAATEEAHQSTIKGLGSIMGG